MIDWGDVCRGDPSIDLAVWSGARSRPDGRADFFAAYGRVERGAARCARGVLALFLCAVLAHYGADEGLDDVVATRRCDGPAAH